MPLNSALVDRARVLSKAASGQRVEGQTTFVETTSAWFRARFDPGTPIGEQAQATGAQENLDNASLLCGVRDSAGKTIRISGQDRIEVQSAQLGNDIFEVVGDPAPLRKRRRVIGWQVTLRALRVHGTPALRR